MNFLPVYKKLDELDTFEAMKKSATFVSSVENLVMKINSGFNLQKLFLKVQHHMNLDGNNSYEVIDPNWSLGDEVGRIELTNYILYRTKQFSKKNDFESMKTWMKSAIAINLASAPNRYWHTHELFRRPEYSILKMRYPDTFNAIEVEVKSEIDRLLKAHDLNIQFLRAADTVTVDRNATISDEQFENVLLKLKYCWPVPQKQSELLHELCIYISDFVSILHAQGRSDLELKVKSVTDKWRLHTDNPDQQRWFEEIFTLRNPAPKRLLISE